MSERSRRDVKSKAEKFAEYRRVREGGGRSIKVRGAARMAYFIIELRRRNKTSTSMTKFQKISTRVLSGGACRETIS